MLECFIKFMQNAKIVWDGHQPWCQISSLMRLKSVYHQSVGALQGTEDGRGGVLFDIIVYFDISTPFVIYEYTPQKS